MYSDQLYIDNFHPNARNIWTQAWDDDRNAYCRGRMCYGIYFCVFNMFFKALRFFLRSRSSHDSETSWSFYCASGGLLLDVIVAARVERFHCDLQRLHVCLSGMITCTSNILPSYCTFQNARYTYCCRYRFIRLVLGFRSISIKLGTTTLLAHCIKNADTWRGTTP